MSIGHFAGCGVNALSGYMSTTVVGWLREAWEVAQSVPTKAVVEAGFKGVEIREELTRRRIAAVASWKEQRCPKPE